MIQKLRGFLQLTMAAWRSEYALRPLPIGLLALVAVISVPLVEAPSGTGLFWLYLLPSLISMPIALVVLFLLWSLTYRMGPQPAWMLFVIGTLAGLTRGVALYFAGELLYSNQVDFPNLENRIFIAVLSWNLSLGFFALVNYLVLTPSRNWGELRSALAEIEDDISDSREQLNWLVQHRVKLIETQLQTEFKRIEELMGEGQTKRSISALAQELRRFTQTQIRDRSKALWSQKASVRATLWRAVLEVFRDSPVLVSVSVVIFTHGYLLNEIRLHGLSYGLIVPLFAALSLTSLLLVAKQIPRGHLRSLVTLWLVPIVQTLITSALFSLLLAERGLDYLLLNSITAGIWTWISIFCASWLASAIERFELEIEALSQQKQDKTETLRWLQAQLDAANREIAKHLHGVLQSRLLGHAIDLERGNSATDPMAELRQTMLQPMQGFGLKQGDLDRELTSVINRWQGFLEVELHPQSQFDPKNLGTQTLEVIQEAIENARRHGGATRATVLITDDSKWRKIEVADNGHGQHSTPGLGSAIFDSLSLGNWSLNFSEAGTSLRLELPLHSEVKT